jgi:hypothetical protein
LIAAIDRTEAIVLIKEASDSGARRFKSCEILGLTLRTLERWEKAEGQYDKRKSAPRVVANKLTEEERNRVLATANSAAYQQLATL